MNSKNQLLRRLERGFRIALISLLVLSFLATSPAHAVDLPNLTIVDGDFALTGGNLVPLETGRTYTIIVKNIGDGATTGPATVVFSELVGPPPATAGLTVTAISGTGWDCISLTCTRSDVLDSQASYPTITVTVTVLVGALPSITNRAVVSGGGADDDPNNNTRDVTSTVNAKADLIITGYQLLDMTKTNVITEPTPNETFWVRMTIENQGGAGTSDFYPGVFLDDSLNYGFDHDTAGVSLPPGYPVVLTLGELTDYQGYRTTTAGCRYYDPNNQVTGDDVVTERGNYHPSAYLPGLPAGSTANYDVEIAYPEADYGDPIYDNIRTGLPGGSFTIYLYADPNCLIDEVTETNNSYTNPISFNIGTVGPTVRTMHPSIGSQDGWVLESTENSEAGGTTNSTDIVLIVGDTASDRQYRSILSFDTSSLPDNAVITQASLSLRINAILGGGNPLKIFNYFKIDVRKGLFGASSLAAQDFQLNPTVTAGPVGALNRGGWYYIDIKTSKVGINPAGLTQIRVRYSLGDNDNGIENIFKFYSGNYSIAKLRPQLSVWYYVP